MRKKQIFIGISYLALSVLFGNMIMMTYMYMRSLKINYAVLDLFMTYTWLYTIFNFLLSSSTGILLLIMRGLKDLLWKIIIAMSGILILLDVPPIIREVKGLILNGTANLPWTIIIFAIHLMLFMSLLRNIDRSSPIQP